MSNTTYEPSLWEKCMETFVYPVFIFIHEFNKNSMLTLYLVLWIALICLLFYVYLNNPYQIITIIPIPILLIGVLLFLVLSFLLCSQFENSVKIEILKENISQMWIGILYIVCFFLFFCGLYYVCKKILLCGELLTCEYISIKSKKNDVNIINPINIKFFFINSLV